MSLSDIWDFLKKRCYEITFKENKTKSNATYDELEICLAH